MSPRARALVGLGIVAGCLVLFGLLWWAIGNRPATLVVEPTPEDATVHVGEESSDGRLELQLPPGPVEVRVEAAGHLSSSITVHLEAGSEVRLTPQLVRRPER